MTAPKTLFWFRQDLRLTDHPMLNQALESSPTMAIYILEDTKDWPLGGASKWWLHHSLRSLQKQIEEKGGELLFFKGTPEILLPKLVKDLKVENVFWSRRYAPHEIERDKTLKAKLEESGVSVTSGKSLLLFEPWEIQNKEGKPYGVFSPFWRMCLTKDIPQPEAFQKGEGFVKGPHPSEALSLEDLGLLPQISWDKDFPKTWTPGQPGAQARLTAFLRNQEKGYKAFRDFPGVEATSRLSPHLHFGEISPRTIYHQTHKAMATGDMAEKDGQNFLSELGWREFSYHLLYYHPTLPEKPLKAQFTDFRWDKNAEFLKRWQKGQTGYPIVDAGMRQLWQTGWMHNRVRMIVASFLIKDLFIHWKEGEDWFWDCLVDADLASNSASWQWVAGSGADAAPYFRIFNPVTQGEKFDAEGDYIRQYVPELKSVPATFIHKPWEAKAADLKDWGVTLGKDYPHPIVDHSKARLEALHRLEEVKK